MHESCNFQLCEEINFLMFKVLMYDLIMKHIYDGIFNVAQKYDVEFMLKWMNSWNGMN